MLKTQICLSWFVLMCGQVLIWRRRDNVFGYVHAGFFFASILIPVVGTTILDHSDPVIVRRYANIMMVGAAAFLAGLLYGAPLGRRLRMPRLSFGESRVTAARWLVRRSRLAALVGIASLLLSFVLLGYAPLLAADKVAAKYGIGAYRPSVSASLIFHVSLLVASAIMPVILALLARRREAVDVLLALGLGLGLSLTLSRGRTFTGPLVFVVALLVVRRWRAWQILAVVCVAYVGAALANELIGIAAPTASTSFATRVATSAPEMSDHLGFLNGFDITGHQHVGMRNIFSALSLDKGDYGPSTYALRIRTGLTDLSGLASGGLRMPAPIWGYAAFGYLGVLAWSFFSGVIIGLGTTFIRRAVEPAAGRADQALTLVLAWVFFEGTFAVAGEFYYPERVGLVAFALALFLAWPSAARRTHDAPPDEPAPALVAGYATRPRHQAGPV